MLQKEKEPALAQAKWTVRRMSWLHPWACYCPRVKEAVLWYSLPLHCGDRFSIYTCIKFLGCTPETNIMLHVNYISVEQKMGPGWCCSVVWASSCEPNGCRFDSRSGHMPGWWVQSPVRVLWKVANQCSSFTSMFLFLSFSLPPPLSKIKSKNKNHRLWIRK